MLIASQVVRLSPLAFRLSPLTYDPYPIAACGVP